VKPSFGSVGDFDSPFESAVARALQDKGWVIHPQIGVSQFRIDLGVVDPNAPGRYLAGIECDGATYHRSATARDRDMVREGVLRGLGWEILRLWSTDFWIDPQGCIDKIDQQLHALLKAANAVLPEGDAAGEQSSSENVSQIAIE
jgi:very-short-patch-repair endonuclease